MLINIQKLKKKRLLRHLKTVNKFSYRPDRQTLKSELVEFNVDRRRIFYMHG